MRFQQLQQFHHTSSDNNTVLSSHNVRNIMINIMDKLQTENTTSTANN